MATAKKTTDVDFLTGLLEAIVNNPKDVKVERTVNELGVLLTVDVNKEDAGLVIGKKGNTISSIRLLVRILGKQNQANISVKLADHLNDRPANPEA